MNEKDSELKTSKKLEILYRLFLGKSLNTMVDDLSAQEVIELQKFMWERTVEMGIKIRGNRFDRKEITRKMKPTANYQRQQGCNEQIYYCKGTHCIHLHPACARKKIKEHVNVMGQAFIGYIQSDKEQE